MQSLLRARPHSLQLMVRRVGRQPPFTAVGPPPPLRSAAAAVRPFSDSAATAAATPASSSTSTIENYEWQFPNAQKLFTKITAALKTEQEVRALQREVYITLGRPLRDAEFYHDGFVAKKSKRGGGAGESEAAKVEEKQTAFDVKLVGFDASAKIKVIKEIRSMLGLGLKEAKELVDSAPAIIQKGVSTEAAEEMKTKLVELGAQIELV